MNCYKGLNMKAPALAFLLATTATNAVMADTPDCVSQFTTPEEEKSFFNQDESRIKACIERKLHPLKNITKDGKLYTVEGGDKIEIYDADDGHKRGRIDLNWDTIQVEVSENDIPYSSLASSAKDRYKSTVLTTCTHVKENLSQVTDTVNAELESFSGEYKSKKDNNFGKDIRVELKNMAQFLEEFCP